MIYWGTFWGVPHAFGLRRALVLGVLSCWAFAQANLNFRVRTDVQLVLIPVHVTSPAGGAVTGLGRANFHLFEDGAEQKITYFANEDAPLSIGFLLDASGSMKGKIEKSLRAAAEFLRSSNPEDEFFLVEFNERPHLTVSFTPDPEELQHRLNRAKTFGRTALFDAVQLGLREERKARNMRKAIVVLSDGGDNHSRRSERDIRDAVREADVQIYTMGLFDPNKRTTEERDGPRLLQDLAEASGGGHFAVAGVDELPAVCERISRELRNQYLLGYTPRVPRDGRYHKVKVTVDSPGTPSIKYRPGYFAALE